MKMQRQDTIVLLLSDTITVAIFKYFLMQYFFKKFEDLIIFSKLILILTSTQHYDNDAEIPSNLYLSQIVLKKGTVIWQRKYWFLHVSFTSFDFHWRWKMIYRARRGNRVKVCVTVKGWLRFIWQEVAGRKG